MGDEVMEAQATCKVPLASIACVMDEGITSNRRWRHRCAAASCQNHRALAR
jgi:hypothetical protein